MVNLTFYTSLDCSTGGVTQSNVTLTAGIADSSAHGPLATGSYSFKAHYNGDTFYGQARSEERRVGEEGITRSARTQCKKRKYTTVGVTTTAGSSKQETASVMGTWLDSRRVLFRSFYTSLDCSTGGVTQSNVTLTAGIADSSAHGPLATGSYSFKAHYNGDTFYGQADSLCEPRSENDTTQLQSRGHRVCHHPPVEITTT